MAFSYEFDPISVLQHSFLMNMRTGNIIIDGIITTIIISLIGNIYTYKNDLQKFFKKIFIFLKGIKENKISFNCTETSNVYSRGGKLKMHGSDAFKAIMLNIKENIKLNKTKNLLHLREFCGDQDEYYWDSDYNSKSIDETIKDIIYLVDQDQDFQIDSAITDGINFRMVSTCEETTEGDKKEKTGKHTIYTLSITTKEKTLEDIQNYINITLDNHLEKVNEKVNNNQFVFIYEGINSENDIIFTTYPFHTTCNIDRVYFEGKEEVMNQIDFFKDNKDWYEENGKPYTLGICSYGPPGCGKTSFEKALAKYLNRHLIIVDISKITTQKEADRIFFSEKINGKDIPYDKRIYIFPDIDAMDSVASRENQEKEKKIDKLEEMIINCRKKDNIDKDFLNLIEIVDQPTKQNKDLLNLSKLLNIVDGIPERTGQIIICCTNHPEKLDPALLRPGRVDCLIHFDKMNVENIVKMVEDYCQNNKYIENNRNKIINSLSVCNKFWSPAEIFQICSRIDNTKDIISFIKKCKKLEIN